MIAVEILRVKRYWQNRNLKRKAGIQNQPKTLQTDTRKAQSTRATDSLGISSAENSISQASEEYALPLQ